MQSSSDTIALPGFELDLAQMLLRDTAGAEVRLRPQAKAVLQFLARHAGRVVTKDELMQSMWAGSVVTDDSLVQCIKEIRQALHDLDHRIVRTSPKRGYWLVLPNGNGGAINGSPANGVPAEAAAGPASAEVNGPSRRRFGLGAAALALGGAGGVAGLSWWLSGGGKTRIQPRAEQPSIVVMPIKNISGGERWDRLARGLTEDITTDLARNHWLFIIASSAAFQRAAGGKDTLAIARELGVRFALEGSLQTEGEAVRVNARLLEAGSGGSVWSQRWDKPAGQLFDIQDSIVGAIDNSLGSAWTGVIATTDRANARRRPTSNLAAYELFLLGVEHKHRFNPLDLAKARDYLERAVQLDPGFAKAWATLAIVHILLRNFASDSSVRRAEMEARLHAATQAHRSDPDDPDTLMQYAWVLGRNGDADGAQKAVRRAVALAPNNADVLIVAAWSGSTNCPLGTDSLDWARHALRLNPNPPNWYYMGLGISALYSGQYEVAVEAFSKAPDMPGAGTTRLLLKRFAAIKAVRGERSSACSSSTRMQRPPCSLPTAASGATHKPAPSSSKAPASPACPSSYVQLHAQAGQPSCSVMQALHAGHRDAGWQCGQGPGPRRKASDALAPTLAAFAWKYAVPTRTRLATCPCFAGPGPLRSPQPR
jgi:TolB-like protein/DNA-binding winged helix-turn-helix (wHTH) protein